MELHRCSQHRVRRTRHCFPDPVLPRRRARDAPYDGNVGGYDGTARRGKDSQAPSNGCAHCPSYFRRARAYPEDNQDHGDLRTRSGEGVQDRVNRAVLGQWDR